MRRLLQKSLKTQRNRTKKTRLTAYRLDANILIYLR